MIVRHCRLFWQYQPIMKKILITLQAGLYAVLFFVLAIYRTDILSRLAEFLKVNMTIGCFGIICLLFVLGAMSVIETLQKHFHKAAVDFYFSVGLNGIHIIVLKAIYCLLNTVLFAGAAAVFGSYFSLNPFVLTIGFALYSVAVFFTGSALHSWQRRREPLSKKSFGLRIANRLIKANTLMAYTIRALTAPGFLGFIIFGIIAIGFSFAVQVPLWAVLYVLAPLSIIPAFALYEREEREAEFLCWLKISKRRMGTVIAGASFLVFFILFIFSAFLYGITGCMTWPMCLLSLTAGSVSLSLAQMLLRIVSAPWLPDRISEVHVGSIILMITFLSFVPFMKIILLGILFRRREKLSDQISYEGA